MPITFATHPFSWRYIYLRVFWTLVRAITLPLRYRQITAQKLHDGVVCKRIHVPSRDKGRNIKVDIYQPAGYDATQPLPVVVNLHGSAFVLPALGSDREFCSLVAAKTSCIVFDADYRKAPEYPYPAASHDAEDVIFYLSAHPDKYDASNIFLSGFSAGGSLVLTTSAALGPSRIKGVVAIYPLVDFTKHYPAPETRFDSGVILPPFIRTLYCDSYIVPTQRRDDPGLSAIFAPSSSFPPHVYLACGKADSFYDPAAKFWKQLKEAGHGDAEFMGVEHEAHGFDKYAKPGTESERKKDKVYAGAIDMIKRAIGLRD